jgi:hypothetical protein
VKITRLSFAAVLATGKSADAIRSERAMGFQEAGLLGVYRAASGAGSAKPSQRSQTRDGGSSALPAVRTLALTGNKTRAFVPAVHASSRSARGEQARTFECVGSSDQNRVSKPFLSISSNGQTKVISGVEARSQDIAGMLGKFTGCVNTIKKRRHETIVFQDDDQGLSISIGSPSLLGLKSLTLQSDLISLSRQYGVTLKKVLINGNPLGRINSPVVLGD